MLTISQVLLLPKPKKGAASNCRSFFYTNHSMELIPKFSLITFEKKYSCKN